MNPQSRVIPSFGMVLQSRAHSSNWKTHHQTPEIATPAAIDPKVHLAHSCARQRPTATGMVMIITIEKNSAN